MTPFQHLKSIASVVLSLCMPFSPPVTMATLHDATLPSLEDLAKVRFAPVEAPNLSGVPTSGDLVEALNSFASYIRGSEILAKYEEPILTRGTVGVTLFRRVSPAVVLIVAAKFVGDQVSDISEGSGVIVDPRGYVLTNWHVLSGYDSALAFLKPPGQAIPLRSLAYSVRLVNYDPNKDLALVRIIQPPANLASVQPVDTSLVEVGQDIHVIGHPGGSEHAWSYTTGVVSQIRRNYVAEFSSGPRLQANLVQIQTAVNPGNSGGPVLDDSGRMVGLVTWGFRTMQNLNFAVASDEISRFITLSLQMATRGRSVPSRQPEKAEYFAGQLNDGRKVLQAQFPDLTVFIVQNTDGQRVGLVAKHKSGLVLKAWEPGVTGGFNQWQLVLKDGKTLKASGRAGLPEAFVGN